MQKVIFLVDMNAFFISCEMVRNPALKGVPAAVAGDPKNRTGIILAANYEARAFGVKTAMVLHEALKLCPGMALVPPDHAYYEQKSRQVMEILSRYSPVVEQNSIDEAWLDMTGCECLSGKPLTAAGLIMQEIESTLGLWCSIGIAPNKFLSKMASEMKKPRGITELWEADIPTKLWPLPVRAMYGIGAKTAEKLVRMGIQTIGDLARIDRSFLVQVFGRTGEVLHQHANGEDASPVTAHVNDDMKSIRRSTTLPEDVSAIETAKKVIMALADDIGQTARRHDKKGHTVQITLKYSDFQVCTRQTSIKATSVTKEIYLAGCRLLEQNWDSKRPVRLIGISLSGFSEETEPIQLSLFDDQDPQNHADPSSQHEKSERIDQTMDAIRNRFGAETITIASLIKKDRPHHPREKKQDSND